jgi:hypothetical protein
MKSAARDWKRQTFPLVFQRLSIQYIEKKILDTESDGSNGSSARCFRIKVVMRLTDVA